METTIRPIAYIKSDFTDKFGIPRQSGLVPELTARIVFEPEYRDPNALVGLDGYSHLWLIWQFSTVAAEYAAGKAGGPPCVRRAWVEMPGAVCLPPAARTAPMRWGFPAWSLQASKTVIFW